MTLGKDAFVTGVVRACHGLDGELKVESLSGEFEHFLSLKHLFLRKGDVWKEFFVDRVSAKSKNVLIKLKGISSVEEAKILVGYEVIVERQNACKLKNGQFYIEDLKHCAIWYNAEFVGNVLDVLDCGNFVLKVFLDASFAEKHNFEKEAYIPFRKEFLVNVDVKNSKIELVSLSILESV